MSHIEPFAATIGAFGNSLIRYGGGFEPIVYRAKFTALLAALNAWRPSQ